MNRIISFGLRLDYAKLISAPLTGLLFFVCAQMVQAERLNGSPRDRLSGTLRTAHFVVSYEPSDPFLAKLLADTAEDELRRISSDLGYSPEKNRPFKLYVFTTHTDFIRAGGLETSKFTVGTTSLGSDEIMVDASGTFDLPERILAHEITHAVVFRMLGFLATEMPLWMHEGLAKYESRESSTYDEEMVATAAAEGSLIPLSHLHNAFPRSNTGLAYAESAAAVKFLIARYGPEIPRRLLKELIRTHSMDAAMIATTGQTISEFEKEWFRAVSKRYRGLRMVRLGTTLVSVMMATLAVVAYLKRRKEQVLEPSYDETCPASEDSKTENCTQ